MNILRLSMVMVPILALSIVNGAVASEHTSAFKLIEDFEGNDPLEDWSVGFSAVEGATTIEVQDDPVNSGQGKVLAIVAGESGNTSIVFDLGDDALVYDEEDPRFQTLYFKIMRPGVENEEGVVVVGTIDSTLGLVSSTEYGGVISETEEPSWGNYSSLIRNSYGTLGVRDYLTDSPGPLEADVWYEMWIVHDFADQSYAVYARGGSDLPEKTLLTKEIVITNYDESVTRRFENDRLPFRRESFSPLDWFMIRYSAAEWKGIHNFYIDDIAVGSEAIESSPVEPPFAGGRVFVEDFEGESVLDDWSVGPIVGDESLLTTIEVQDDPVDSGQGKVLAIVAGEAGNTSIVYDLGDRGLVPGGNDTIYFKVMRPLEETDNGAFVPAILDASLGMVSSEEYGGLKDETEHPHWGHYASYVRYISSNPLDIIGSGEAFTGWINEGPADAGIWYEIWMVHDFSDFSYRVYARGGTDFPVKTLLTKERIILNDDQSVQVVFEGDKVDFRVPSLAPLDWFMIRYSAHPYKGIHNLYIDDVAVGRNEVDVTRKLVNISTRAWVGSGKDVMIGGFYVDGDKPMEVLIRGVGPELAGLEGNGLTAGELLADPTITLVKETGDEIVSTDWETESNSADIVNAALDVGAFSLDAGSKSSALLVTLEPGIYSVVVDGNGGEGVALVEVYEVP